jgi:hypothetical protein
LRGDIALQIRAKIKSETGLNAFAGISYNKFLAKLPSDHRKPDGQYVITPEMGQAFVETLPVGKFHGIGPATAASPYPMGDFHLLFFASFPGALCFGVKPGFPSMCGIGGNPSSALAEFEQHLAASLGTFQSLRDFVDGVNANPSKTYSHVGARQRG